MTEVFKHLTPAATPLAMLLLVACSVVCSVCLKSIYRSRNAGWYRGPAGNPLSFLALLAGAVVPPFVILVLFHEFLLVFIFVMLTATLIMNFLFPEKPGARAYSQAAPTRRTSQIATEPIVANADTKVYHRTGPGGCEYAAKIGTRKRIYFPRTEAALQNGFSPCNWCYKRY